MQSQRFTSKIVAAFVLGMAFCLSPLPEALAIKVHSMTDSDGFTENRVYTDEGKWMYTVHYDPEGRCIGTEYPDGNPSEDGQNTGLGPSEEDMDIVAEQLKVLADSPLPRCRHLGERIGLFPYLSGPRTIRHRSFGR